MSNDQMRELWARGAEVWVEHKDIYDRELRGFADAVLAAIDPRPGLRILDIGCGTGTLLELAAESGASGVGFDISETMIRAAAERVPAASFVVADAQTTDLTDGGPYDAVVSRFGAMFFDEPAVAFANIRKALRPGAPMAFVCWRGLDENQMFTLGNSVLADRLDPRPPPPAPGAPGPTALADPERIRAILAEAGWTSVGIEKLDIVCDYGRDGGDGVEDRLVTVLGSMSGRFAREQLEGRLGPEGWAAVVDEVRVELRRHLVDGRVQFNGATWLVTAKA
ncbi:class I SAM-dependent methyltransferase [Jongsikchunia kroppenstedtii]|uniref:class I SAM-dependent methyltransferase n=1 Tax=Jongsikchunia kroppenstedtii TaxID=1121721 RepID=UPI00036E95EF|nr:class I SAM-dependent methyltransferase [Jongsikchunia kroppenstedtii]